MARDQRWWLRGRGNCVFQSWYLDDDSFAVGLDPYRLRPVPLSRRFGYDRVHCRIHGNGHAPSGIADFNTVSLHLQPRDMGRTGHRDRDFRKLLDQSVRTLAGNVGAIHLARFARRFRRRLKRSPSARRLPVPLVALAEIQERTHGWIKLVAVDEFGTRLGKLAVLHQPPRVLKERFGRGLLLGSSPGSRRNQHCTHGGNASDNQCANRFHGSF